MNTQSTPLPNSHFDPMDKEELALLEALEEPIKFYSKEEETTIRKKMQKSAKFTMEKSHPISLRLRNPVYKKLKSKAFDQGIPYQVILSTLAEQYTKGKIKLTI